MSPMRYDRAARRDSVRNGGADDYRPGPSGFGSLPATARQETEMVDLSIDTGMALPVGSVSRNAAKRWLAKARVKQTLGRAS